jgi:hypothetical protein
MSEIRQVAYCPHCSNRAPQKLLHVQRYQERVWSSDGSEDETPWSAFVAICETCHHLLVYENLGDQLEDEKFTLGELAYPVSEHLHVAVPSSIRKVYEEASRIKNIAPNAFAVQIRRALEALCEDRGAKKGNLQNRLKNLSEKGEIPPVLAEATDTLRLLGNIAAHGIDDSVHPLQAFTIDEFFRAVVEYVYVAPSKLKEFKARLRKSKKAEEAGEKA